MEALGSFRKNSLCVPSHFSINGFGNPKGTGYLFKKSKNLIGLLKFDYICIVSHTSGGRPSGIS